MATTPTLPPNVPISDLTWPCTHNAFNSAAELTHAGANGGGGTNQNASILDQLDAGVRVLMIDVHSNGGGPRVRHEGGMADHDLPYEDLCDLLIKLRAWLDTNHDQVVMLLMEVTNDVDPQWIHDTFAGAGPVQGAQYYDMRGLIYTHPAGQPWPTLAELVAAGTRLVVFRETDGEKGRITDANGVVVPGLEWYHDMWAHWLETPYSNVWHWDDGKEYWSDLQRHTYELSPPARGNPETAAFFNLNHFVDVGTLSAGSAGAAAGINASAYLTARALIAWKMQARRPTFSIDFFAPGDGTIATADYLNAVATVSGTVTLAGGAPLRDAITWEGVTQLEFSEHLGATYLDWTIGNASPAQVPTSRLGAYCFPRDTRGHAMTLTPTHPAYVFTPASVTWNGVDSTVVDFTATPRDAVVESGASYLVCCESENEAVHLTTASGTYARTSVGNPLRHELVRVRGDGPVVSGDEVYLRSTEQALLGYYLRPGYDDLWYEAGANPTTDHRWRVTKIGGADDLVRLGDTVALERPDARNSYMSAKGVEDYVNLTDDRVPGWSFMHAH